MELHLDKKKSKKAYLQIDFSIAIFMFFIIFLLFYLLYDSYREIETKQEKLIELNADARDICALLISGPGIPNNYETNISNMKQIGLKLISSPELSTAKLNVFNSSNYFTIADKIKSERFFHIVISGIISKNISLNFGVQSGISSIYATYVCYSNYNNEIVKIFVEVWE